MSEFDAYVAKYFLSAPQFAAARGLNQVDLDGLIRERLIPEPSYVVANGTVTSYVFGRMPAPGASDGSYFHPAQQTWVHVAREIIEDVGPRRAGAVLRTRFEARWVTALTELNASVWRLRDSFADDGSPIEEGMRLRLDSAWEHFLRGTFGLCVANPVSEASIARKEILQEKLAALTHNGMKADFPEAEVPAMTALIAAYAQASMPFSPIEYPVSSRKRLVEDLLMRMRAC